MGRVRRISIALEEDVYRLIDKAMLSLGETNRSRFISSLISNCLAESAFEGEVFGLVVMVYDHEVGEVDKALTHIQHEYRDLIRVTTHVHLGERDCAEVIHVVGSAQKVQELLRDISRVRKGLKYLRGLYIPLAR